MTRNEHNAFDMYIDNNDRVYVLFEYDNVEHHVFISTREMMLNALTRHDDNKQRE